MEIWHIHYYESIVNSLAQYTSTKPKSHTLGLFVANVAVMFSKEEHQWMVLRKLNIISRLSRKCEVTAAFFLFALGVPDTTNFRCMKEKLHVSVLIHKS